MNKLILSDMWFMNDGSATFSTIFADCIFCADFTSGKISQMGKYYDDKTYRLHPNCFVVKNKVFLLPDRADDIIVFNQNFEEEKRIVIDNPDKKRLMIRNFYVDENDAWLVSGGLHTIIRLDLETYSVEYYKIGDGQIDKILGSSKKENKIYVIATSNKIYCFDVSDKKILSVEHNLIDDDLNTILCVDDEIWMTGKKNKIYILNLLTGNVREIVEFPASFFRYDLADDGEEHYLFYKSMIVNNKIWFMQFYGSSDVFVSIDDYIINAICPNGIKYTSYDESSHSPLSAFLYVRDGRYIGKMVDASSEIYEIDCDSLECKLIDFEVDFGIKKNIMFKRPVNDKRVYGLEEFIEDIKNI